MSENYKSIMGILTEKKNNSETELLGLHNSQKNALTKLRILVTSLLNKCEDELSGKLPRDEQFWGEKETPVSSLGKLTQILLKVIVAEREIYNIDQSLELNEELTKVSDEDIAIIKSYLQKISDQEKSYN